MKVPSHPTQDDPILDGIATSLRRFQPDAGVITGYVVVTEWIDEDGDRRIYSATFEDQRCHVTLGLLDFGQAVERARAVDSWREDP